MKGSLKKRMIQVIVVLTILFISSMLLVAFMNYQIINRSEKYWITDLDRCPKVKVALILGARVFEGGVLSTILSDRMDTGIALYKLGKVEKLLLSGDHGRVHYDEVSAMKNYAVQRGVDSQDIFLDHAGFRTYDSLYRAKEVFNIKALIVVTQKFHLDRAIYTGRHLGLEVYGIPADKRIYLKHRLNQLREILARSTAFLELHVFTHKPKYLGSVHDIAGDGRQTHD